ncbi:MAG: metallophosphatase family protein [Candidatus Pacebacteria bacterium]|nr:metallophosphatase family protein [Candidatus Paceibacterota bacterium]
MRYAIVSDIHSNSQAWEAVLLDIRSQDVDEIICLGDVVGYGPEPARVMQSAYTHVHHFVLGNHDAVLAGRLDPANFNDEARKIITWTAAQLDAKAHRFFEELPLVIQAHDFRCAHAELGVPGQWRYIIDAEEATDSWGACNDPLMFVGHTHIPAVFVVGNSGTPHKLVAQDFALEQGKRYIVNVGSAGQPRDGDMRSSYSVFDTTTQSVYFRRVPFDIDAYRAALEYNALPAGPSYFLSVADNKPLRSVRETLDFRPPESAREDTSVVSIEQMARSVRRWKTLSCAIAAAAAVIALVTAVTFWLTRDPTTIIHASKQSWPTLARPTVQKELLHTPEPVGAITTERPLHFWHVELTHLDAQTVRAVKPDDPDTPSAAIFEMHSETASRMAILSPRITAESGTRFTAKAQFLKTELQDGFVAVALIRELKDGTRELLATSELGPHAPDDRWLPRSATMDEPLRADAVLRYAIRGQFKGDIAVRKWSCFRRE